MPALSVPRQRVALIAAALAAAIVALSIFGNAVRIGCLVVIVIATRALAPLRGEPGGGWWSLLAAGAAASIAGWLIAQGAETLGGLIALVGGGLVIIAAAIAFPLDD